MKSRITRPVFFIVAILILVFTWLSMMGVSTRYGDTQQHYIWGIDDIRWGIDIRGGVNVSFGVPADYAAENEITQSDLEAAKSIIETRLIDKNINDYEVYLDNTANTIIVRFPWQAEDESFDPEQAVKEIGETAMLTFREEYEVDDEGQPTGVTENVILQGKDVDNAYVSYDTETNQYVVALNLNDTGTKAFADATARLVGKQISIWMDDICISAPNVSVPITGGKAIITSPQYVDFEPAQDLANKINGGSLPFKLEIENLSTISPILGMGARDAMAIAGLIAFIVIAIFMIAYYRLTGFVAVIALIGQIAGMFAATTGFFAFNDASTLTIPGIAGIILSIGMGVDANVISSERIREELRSGRTIDGALQNGFERGFGAILDGNVTVIIVAVILMAVFGNWFGVTTDATIFSFGFTLLAGIVMNFVMGCWATRLMTVSLSRFRIFRKPWLYGGARGAEAAAIAERGKDTVKMVDVKCKTHFDFVKKTKVFAIISGAIVLVTVLFSFIQGPEIDIRFKGGTMVTYSYTGEVDTDDIAEAVKGVGAPNPNVTTGTSFVGDLNTIVISFVADDNMADDARTKMLSDITDTLQTMYPDSEIDNIDTTDVSASSGSRFVVNCVVAVAIAFVLLVIYIALRFKNIGGWSSGVIAIICLLHDVSIAYAVYLFSGMPLDANFMAVVLTLLGYSINNTIIIYDRLRENRARYGSMDDRELVNLSINQTLSRSVITTVTAASSMVVVCIVCWLMGVTSIISFATPLAVGMGVGFYSSVCLAGPIWIWWTTRKSRKNTKKTA